MILVVCSWSHMPSSSVELKIQGAQRCQCALVSAVSTNLCIWGHPESLGHAYSMTMLGCHRCMPSVSGEHVVQACIRSLLHLHDALLSAPAHLPQKHHG